MVGMQARYDAIQCFVVRGKPRDAEFLQVRRAPDDYMGDTWQQVYGCAEPGELAWQAALRELREETGLAPAEFYRLGTVNTFYIPPQDCIFHCPVFCAIVAPDAAVQLNAEHTAFRWIPRNQIEQALMWPGEKTAVVELMREILDNGASKPYLRIPV